MALAYAMVGICDGSIAKVPSTLDGILLLFETATTLTAMMAAVLSVAWLVEQSQPVQLLSSNLHANPGVRSRERPAIEIYEKCVSGGRRCVGLKIHQRRYRCCRRGFVYGSLACLGHLALPAGAGNQ